MDQHGAVFATLHDQRRRTHLEDLASGAEKIMFVGELAGF